MSKDRSDEAVNIILRLSGHPAARGNAIERATDAKRLFDLMVDQAVEEARNQRKGLDGDNRRKTTGDSRGG